MPELDELSRVLGGIEGELKGIRSEQERQGVQLNTVSKKVNSLEIRAASTGGASGGIVSLIVSVGISMLGLPTGKGG